jgi:hypothetical protein
MASLHVISSFYIKWHKQTLNQEEKVMACPFRVTLGLLREMLASRRKTLCLIGPLDQTTRATWHTTASKVSQTLGDVMGLPRPKS